MNALKTVNLIRSTLLVTSLTMTVGCLQGGGGSGSAETQLDNLSQEQMAKASPVSLKLMDTPDGQYQNIMVKVKELEVILAKEDKAAKVVLSKDVGLIDLMDLQNGMMMNLSSLQVPNGVFIREIRLRLEENSSYVVRQDGSVCNLKTPSAIKSGLKLKLPDSVQVETGYSYNIVVHFNASKQIVQQGNGGCLLKPVLKLHAATRAVVDQPGSGDEPIIDDGDTGSDDGSDDGSGDTGSDDGSGDTGSDDGSGDTGSDDGSDDTGSDDGSDEYQEGVDYIVEGDKILIPQPDGTYIVVEGVDLTVISIEEILSYFK